MIKVEFANIMQMIKPLKADDSVSLQTNLTKFVSKRPRNARSSIAECSWLSSILKV